MSLILEYCANGNLHDYLHEHGKEFTHNIISSRNRNIIETKGTSQHNLELLLRWTHQV